MSYQLFRIVDFGKSKGGLATVGYTLTGGTRTTSGVAEIGTGTGIYGATITIADGFSGSILWDTGEASPVYAAGAINPGDDERTDAKVSSASSTDVTLAADGLDAVAIGGGTLPEAIRAMAAVLAGDVVESETADGSVATTTFRDFRDGATARVTSSSTDTSRTVTVN